MDDVSSHLQSIVFAGHFGPLFGWPKFFLIHEFKRRGALPSLVEHGMMENLAKAKPCMSSNMKFLLIALSLSGGLLVVPQPVTAQSSQYGNPVPPPPSSNSQYGYPVPRPPIPPPPSSPRAQQKVIKVCMGNGGGPSCAVGADVVYDCQMYEGIGRGSQLTVDTLSQLFCQYYDNGTMKIAHHKVIPIYNVAGGECGLTMFQVTCNP
jgi:hypothetical protein